ncbi:MAG TPA: ABC transporter substrate-binding protein [Casimicrobiaceae bacterium]|nr:ABC transporter substrate-binding protein [Casimicrobiaceae bacterium]
MKTFAKSVRATALAIVIILPGAVAAAEIRVACYSDGNECDVTQDLAKRFEAQNADVKVVIDKVPYKAIVEQLPVQLAAGEGPDIARVTDLGGLAKYYLDIAPYVKDPKYWEANFGTTLPWLRPTPTDRGIYGMMTQLTVTGPFVNKTLFEQANVPLPGPKATWDEWADATRKVAKATQVPFAIAFDRSGHRFAGAAISMGAKYFDAKGNLVVDDGYKAMAKKVYDWNRDGTMPKDVWGGVGGSTYRDAFEEFANGRVVMYLSGSWQTRRMDSQIGKNFDWIAVPNPCGPAACTGIPGGAAFVALKRTKAPKEVGRFLDFLASEPVYAEYMSRTENIPAHAGVAKKGVEYKISPQAKAVLNTFVAEVPKLSPVAYQIQGYKYNRAIFNPTAARLGQAIVGEMSLDDALKRIASDADEQVKAAAK